MICCKCRRDVPEGRFCILCGADQTPVSKKRKALKRANGTGTVYKLSGRRRRPWVAANDKIIIGYYDTKTAAIEALNRLTDVSLTDRYNYTFAQVFDKWASEYYDTVGDSATVIYDIAYKVFTPLHNEKFRNLRTSDFQAVINAHLDKSHSTLSKYKSLVNLMSQWALREEIITSNFAQYVTLPPAQKKEKPIFTAEEIARIEAEAEHDETARIVCMLLATGMRIGAAYMAGMALGVCVGGGRGVREPDEHRIPSADGTFRPGCKIFRMEESCGDNAPTCARRMQLCGKTRFRFFGYFRLAKKVSPLFSVNICRTAQNCLTCKNIMV